MKSVFVRESSVWFWGLRLLAVNVALGIACVAVFLLVAMASSLLQPTFLLVWLVCPLFTVLFIFAWSFFGFQLGQKVPGNIFINGLVVGSIAALPLLALGSCWGLALTMSYLDCIGASIFPPLIFAAGIANPLVVVLTSWLGRK